MEAQEASVEKSDGRVEYSTLKRYLVLGLVSMAGLLGPISSTIYFPSSNSVIRDLQTTGAMFDLTIGAFMITLGVMPLIWGGISDRYGRRWVFIISLIIATAGNVGGGLARSIEQLIAMRVVQGIGSSAPMVTGVGVVADIFPKDELGLAMSTFFVGVLVGPIVGPILGGFLDVMLGWQSTFFFLAALSGLEAVLFLLFFRETLPTANRKVFPVLLQAWPPRIKRGGPLFNPFSALGYLRYPSVLLSGCVAAVCFGTFFAVESFHSRAMAEKYAINPSEVGLTFVVLGLGSCIGNFSGGRLADLLSRRTRQEGRSVPEARLYGVWACILVLIGGLLLYGWSLEAGLPIGVPLTGLFALGFGFTSACIGVNSYLIELAPNRAASVSSSSSILRLGLATLLSSTNSNVIDHFGYGRGISLYAAICSIAFFVTLLLIFRGQRIRAAFP